MRIKMEDKEIDFRVSTIPVQHGESIVIRILSISQTVSSS
jgi:type II secretory ATPase GspE/PulE/Tfp pilus assembly ATPase PilB-like protein